MLPIACFNQICGLHILQMSKTIDKLMPKQVPRYSEIAGPNKGATKDTRHLPSCCSVHDTAPSVRHPSKNEHAANFLSNAQISSPARAESLQSVPNNGGTADPAVRRFGLVGLAGGPRRSQAPTGSKSTAYVDSARVSHDPRPLSEPELRVQSGCTRRNEPPTAPGSGSNRRRLRMAASSPASSAPPVPAAWSRVGAPHAAASTMVMPYASARAGCTLRAVWAKRRARSPGPRKEPGCGSRKGRDVPEQEGSDGGAQADGGGCSPK